MLGTAAARGCLRVVALTHHRSSRSDLLASRTDVGDASSRPLVSAARELSSIGAYIVLLVLTPFALAIMALARLMTSRRKGASNLARPIRR